MLDIDRDICLALAKTLQLDFQMLADLIDGKRNAANGVAMAIAWETGTNQALWMNDGQAKARLVALKIWPHRLARLQKPMPRIESQEPPPRQTRGGCPNCD